MYTYTVFCRSTDNIGTTWIDTVEADSYQEAMEIGRAACQADWKMSIDSIHVLGIVEGRANILFWEDVDA